ncbi:MAG: RNase adapter RapZ [Pseudohongiellaceae bacterium]|nr:RNase adapter RapZ [Pseudohongiellaceae bacterium]
MKLLIISGRSGSGKSTALNMLEDHGYYCIDNLPASLLPALSTRLSATGEELTDVAVSIDARNLPLDLEQVPAIIEQLSANGIKAEIVFLDANSPTLIKRFSENRRKHPLTTKEIGLREAINMETKLLEPLALLACLSIDTSSMSLHQLRDNIKSRVVERDDSGLALMFESFGYKHGVPIDADFVFDVRCLPNPYWEADLRPYTGLDLQVKDWLESQAEVQQMYDDLCSFLDKWLPKFSESNRSYMTVAIGCTGGQHRSVYLSERLSKHFSQTIKNARVLHRELDKRETK